ncbi:hypothetical protein ALC60_00909 [Trachymyrmex zeteki]|uniref:Uncharacterized protein n=1 Tax=Mycetomoellerius zeteki TaxID=64791 RepID=A0A151XIE3_9HYME|nr:hypothetical protein ALC60_00909 [Trachymyrmex zeteki]
MVIKVVSLKLSRCTLTLLQRPDWYDRFVVTGVLCTGLRGKWPSNSLDVP